MIRLKEFGFWYNNLKIPNLAEVTFVVEGREYSGKLIAIPYLTEDRKGHCYFYGGKSKRGHILRGLKVVPMYMKGLHKDDALLIRKMDEKYMSKYFVGIIDHHDKLINVCSEIDNITLINRKNEGSKVENGYYSIF